MMEKSLDRSGEPVEKVRELKKVRGYVAPTDTGTIRTVKAHTKLVEVDVKKEKKEKGSGVTGPSTKLPGAPTVKEAASKIKELNKLARASDFNGNTSKISELTTDFYRGGVNTSGDSLLNRSDGLATTLRDMNTSLLDIGFDNRYNLSAEAAMIKLTSPEYMRSMATKVGMVERRLKELGLSTSRLDPFTVAIEDADGKGKRIYVSNNPLDHITSREMSGKLTPEDVNVITGLHQDRMNDFVFYTATKPNGGTKTASATASYDPATKRFYHFEEPIAHGNDKKSAHLIDEVLRKETKSKKILPGSGRKSLADVEVFEIKAMISERLTTMQNEIEQEVKTGKSEKLPSMVESVEKLFNRTTVGENFANEIGSAMKEVNDSFEKLAAVKTPKSFAYKSPLHQALQEFVAIRDNVIAMINKTLAEHQGKWTELKARMKKR